MLYRGNATCTALSLFWYHYASIEFWSVQYYVAQNRNYTLTELMAKFKMNVFPAPCNMVLHI